MDQYLGFLLIETPDNRSVELQPITMEDTFEAVFELHYYGTTNLTAYVRDSKNHVSLIWESSIFFSGGSVGSYDVFGVGLVAPQALSSADNLYGGDIIVQLRSSAGDLLPCQADSGSFRVHVTDSQTGQILCNDSMMVRDQEQRRFILTYNFTRSSGSQVIDILRNDIIIHTRTVVFDTGNKPSIAL